MILLVMILRPSAACAPGSGWVRVRGARDCKPRPQRGSVDVPFFGRAGAPRPPSGIQRVEFLTRRPFPHFFL